MKTLPSAGLLTLLLGLALLAPPSAQAAKLPVVASIYPIADMVQQVGGPYVDVTVVLPAGASPHTFEPKVGLVRKIAAARIFFMIGAGLEFWAQRFAQAAGPGLRSVALSEGIALLHTVDPHHAAEAHRQQGPGAEHDAAANPHIWLDPVIAAKMVARIATALAEADPAHAAHFHQQEQQYLQALKQLDRLIEASVARWRLREFVAFHASWDYFARRYGLIPVGVVEAAPGREPTPLAIKQIITLIAKHRLRAVFAEPQLNSRAAEVIAQEARVRVLILDPVGGPGLQGRSTYIDLMKFNLNVWQEAMQ